MFSREWRSLFGIIIIFRITIIVCIPFDISGPVEEPQTKSTKLTTRRLRCQSSLDFSIIFFLSLRFILIPFAHFKPYVSSQIEEILQLNVQKPNFCGTILKGNMVSVLTRFGDAILIHIFHNSLPLVDPVLSQSLTSLTSTLAQTHKSLCGGKRKRIGTEKWNCATKTDFSLD